METVLQDIRCALRMLQQESWFHPPQRCFPWPLGIGANTAIFTVINAVLLRPLPFLHARRLVALWEVHPQQEMDRAAVSPPNFVDWSTQSRTLEQIAAYPVLGILSSQARTRRSASTAPACPPACFHCWESNPFWAGLFLPEEDRFGSIMSCW